jgi:heterodisulfide reductase subunit A
MLMQGPDNSRPFRNGASPPESPGPTNGAAGPRIGVYVCHCGSNIAGVVDCQAVAAYGEALPGVVVSRDDRYLCSEPGQNLIKADIREQGLDRVVIASCSPRLHEPTFRKCVSEAGLNPYLMDMANLREQCSWVHSQDQQAATQKSMDLLRSAVARARRLAVRAEMQVPVEPAALVVGGGVAGIQTALDLADSGYKVFMVEKRPSIGGVMAWLDKTYPTMDCSI